MCPYRLVEIRLLALQESHHILQIPVWHSFPARKVIKWNIVLIMDETFAFTVFVKVISALVVVGHELTLVGHLRLVSLMRACTPLSTSTTLEMQTQRRFCAAAVACHKPGQSQSGF
jgi:hypothetical protein